MFADSDDHDEEPIIFGPAEEVVTGRQQRW